VLRAAARRFLVLLVLVGAITVVCSLLLGLLVGAAATRSVSLGLYLVGAFFLLGGFLFGNRGPLRRAGESTATRSFSRPLRRATPDEMRETVNSTLLLVVVGMVLLIVAVTVDPRTDLV
jgi:hypothetical protein